MTIDAEPVGKPVPVADIVSAPYWEAARRHELLVQRCRPCGRYQYPPDLLCRHCQSDDLGWERSDGRGSIYTFAVYTRSFVPTFTAPYALALVDLADAGGVRLLTNIVETPIETLRVGLPVEVVFEERSGWAIPQFRGAGA